MTTYLCVAIILIIIGSNGWRSTSAEIASAGVVGAVVEQAIGYDTEWSVTAVAIVAIFPSCPVMDPLMMTFPIHYT